MEKHSKYDQDGALKQVAHLQIEQANRDISTISELHSADYRWITASLLLLNSGGAVAVLNTEFVNIEGKIHAGISFVMGMVFALSVAWLSQITTTKLIHPLTMYRTYWVKILHGHAYDEAEELTESDALRAKRARIAWPVPTAGWLSLLSFLGAMYFVGQGIVSKDGQPTRMNHSSSEIRQTKLQ